MLLNQNARVDVFDEVIVSQIKLSNYKSENNFIVWFENFFKF
jgi:hypothetical protein